MGKHDLETAMKRRGRKIPITPGVRPNNSKELSMKFRVGDKVKAKKEIKDPGLSETIKPGTKGTVVAIKSNPRKGECPISVSFEGATKVVYAFETELRHRVW